MIKTQIGRGGKLYGDNKRMMGFLYGLVGALLGFILGGVTALFVDTIAMGGDEFGVAFTIIIFGPVGLVVGAVLGIVSALCVLRYVRRRGKDKATRRKNAFLVGGFVLAVPVLVTAMLWDVQCYGNPPSDQELLSNFERHRDTFEELARMTQTDKGLTRVDWNWTNPSDPQTIGVSSARIGRYRRLLDSAQVHRGFESDGKGSNVEFLYWGQGSAISSDTDKGYAYLTVAPKQLFSSLDGRQPNENGVQAYRHIQGCWYLYYDYIPG